MYSIFQSALYSGHTLSARHGGARTSAIHARHATEPIASSVSPPHPAPPHPQDVFKPDPARLRRSLCALINFAKFREEKVALVDELEERVAGRVQEAASAEAELERNVSRRPALGSACCRRMTGWATIPRPDSTRPWCQLPVGRSLVVEQWCV